MIYPTINLPAGYEVVNAEWAECATTKTPVLVATWAVPGGPFVYISMGLVTKSLSDEDWTKMLALVISHVQRRHGPAAKGAEPPNLALADRPPTTGDILNEQRLLSIEGAVLPGCPEAKPGV